MIAFALYEFVEFEKIGICLKTDFTIKKIKNYLKIYFDMWAKNNKFPFL